MCNGWCYFWVTYHLMEPGDLNDHHWFRQWMVTQPLCDGMHQSDKKQYWCRISFETDVFQLWLDLNWNWCIWITLKIIFANICLVSLRRRNQYVLITTFMWSVQINFDGLTHLPLDKMANSLAEDIFKDIFLNENFEWEFSLRFH